MNYDILYHFSHGPVHLIETKRLDLPSSAGPSEVYQWTLIEDRTVHLLHFDSMSMKPQRRIFSEGAIEFDLNSCRGQLLGKSLELTRQEKIGDSLRKLLENALRTKSTV